MKTNEEAYHKLVVDILDYGYSKDGRNGATITLPGTQIKLDVSNNTLPIITGRKMFYKGIIGEALALMQSPCNNVSDFEERGCRYWKLWAKDGKLDLDYPVNSHFKRIIKSIKEDPNSRRHIIDLWNEDRIEQLSLPCCHTQYQFIIINKDIHMIWTQRSADVMIGVPSDMILATIYLNIIAAETGYTPGTITMNFGDTHIYSSHLKGARDYVNRKHHKPPKLLIRKKPFEELTPEDFEVVDYKHEEPIKFELKA